MLVELAPAVATWNKRKEALTFFVISVCICLRLCTLLLSEANASWPRRTKRLCLQRLWSTCISAWNCFLLLFSSISSNVICIDKWLGIVIPDWIFFRKQCRCKICYTSCYMKIPLCYMSRLSRLLPGCCHHTVAALCCWYFVQCKKAKPA